MNTEERGFTIKDKRFSTSIKEGQTHVSDDTREKEILEENKSPQKGRIKKEGSGNGSERATIQFPEINFATFILSLSSSAMLHFGDVEDPISGKKERNLPMVKQTIDMIDMLKEKTRGNLTPDEDRLIDNIIYELKMRYVKELNKGA